MNTLIIPVYAALLSLLFLLLHTVVIAFTRWHAKSKRLSTERDHGTNQADARATLRVTARFRKHVLDLGGWAILIWRTSRLVALVILWALQTAYTISLSSNRAEDEGHADPLRWVQLSLHAVYVRLPAQCMRKRTVMLTI